MNQSCHYWIERFCSPILNETEEFLFDSNRIIMYDVSYFTPQTEDRVLRCEILFSSE